MLHNRVSWTVRIYDAYAVHSQLVGVLSLYFQIQKLKALRKWFWLGFICAGLDLKDDFLHVE